MHNEHLADELRKVLPPIFTRKQACEALGGLLSVKTLANLDSMKMGPKGRIQVGRRVAYTREGFVDWVLSRVSSPAIKCQDKA